MAWGVTRKLGSILAAAVTCLAVLVFNSPLASATSYYYNAANLISDSNFTNYGVMSTSSIQSFLESKNSGLATYKDYEYCGSSSGAHYSFYKTYYACDGGTSSNKHSKSKVSAAEIIHDAAHAYKISPRAILATLQKEQSLVTNPNPTQSDINCAMGYNSCSGFSGFFLQVDNGTWQFRVYIELMNNRSYWGYDPSSYPCASGHDVDSSNNLYSTGLYPGRTVTFYNPGGSSRTIKIVNSATAALYCYTPYVGPYSATGYSGSYNFVISYEQWWGSTVFSWAADASASVFTGSDYATGDVTSSIPALSYGDKLYVKVSAVNTGSKTWTHSSTELGTAGPHNRLSDFCDATWVNCGHPGYLIESSVAPGSTGTFEFPIDAALQDGAYSEQFQLVERGSGGGWMDDSATFTISLTVSNPYNGKVSSVTTYSDSAYSKVFKGSWMLSGQKLYVKVIAKNTGQNQWDTNSRVVSIAAPRSASMSAFCDSTWIDYSSPCTKAAHPVESTVASGSNGTFKFALNGPANADGGIYGQSFQLVQNGTGGSWMPGGTFSWGGIHVYTSRPDNMYANDAMRHGDAMYSYNSVYKYVMQGDGNLVLYHSGHPIWDTGTNGKHGSKFTMQGDGNLVLYDNHGHALWNTHTNGHPGAKLALQNDGNFVLYDHGKVIWTSHTNGK